MTVLYYDCFSGISGDMNLGALADLGVDHEYLKSELSRLDIKGYKLDLVKDNRKGITGTRAMITISGNNEGSGQAGSDNHHHEPEDQHHGTEDHHHDLKDYQHDSKYHEHSPENEHSNIKSTQHSPGNHPQNSEDHTHGKENHSHDQTGLFHGTMNHHHGTNDEFHGIVSHQHNGHRNFNDIKKIINASGLNDYVKNKSLEIFQKIAEAESKIHGKPIDEIHFHEVGAIDSIVDIVGAAICIDYLKPDRIISSSVELGGGFVKCEHGIFPVPAPATAEILKDIPVKYGAVQSETTTPTGAAILTSFADEFTDKLHFKICKTGYGIGTKDFDIPNVLRVYMGELENNAASGLEMLTASLIECNIDDMNPEIYGYIMDQLFDMGADDVFITPIIMKKARPASKLSVLCNPEIENNLTELLLTHTTSLGVRKHRVEKTLLQREYQKLETKYGPVTLKTAIYKGKKLKSKPEYEDCVRLAKKNNISVHIVYREINRLLANLNNDAG